MMTSNYSEVFKTVFENALDIISNCNAGIYGFTKPVACAIHQREDRCFVLFDNAVLHRYDNDGRGELIRLDCDIVNVTTRRNYVRTKIVVIKCGGARYRYPHLEGFGDDAAVAAGDGKTARIRTNF